MGEITIEFLKANPVAEQEVELVERKGVGHPDHIVDAIMDRISQRLSQYYRSRFGRVLHHNIDKALLVAGGAETRFGGGEVTSPMLFVFGDRATTEYAGEKIPVAEFAIDSAKKWFKEELRFVDPDCHVTYQVEIKPASIELSSIFDSSAEILKANDTSAAVGYAPLSPTEKLVLETERFLNSKQFKVEHPEVGEDIKVMGFRNKNQLSLTVAIAFVDKYIASEKEYFYKKEKIVSLLHDKFGSSSNFKNIRFDINTLDRKGLGLSGVYTSVTGTSAENGDSGQVGRGNRVNGLISLNRPMGTEAAAGKNPVSHVGKIYNFLSHEIAENIVNEVQGIKEVYVWLCSQISKPVDEPMITAVQIIPQPGIDSEKVRKLARETTQKGLENILDLIEELIEGKRSVC
ncbi:MAG: S-adenosylmethionine synthase [candidate division WS2 bacterium]|nr:S-adenosylmethionine synthase [Candidatus Lithacetigena glycinireducens]